MINTTAKANRKIQPQDELASTDAPRGNVAQGKRHNLRNPQESSPAKRAKADPPSTAEKRGRGRPRKERPDEKQPQAEQIPKEPQSGALKMPSKRLGRNQNVPSKNGGTEQETFDVPDDTPNPTAKSTKGIGNRKQLQRSNNATKSTSAVDTGTDTAANIGSNQKNLASQVKQRRAKAIEEHAKSLDEAGKGSTSLADDPIHPEGHVRMEVPETQDPFGITSPEHNDSNAPLAANDELISSIEQPQLLGEELGCTTLQNEDADGDSDFQPSGVAGDGFVADTELEKLGNEDISEDEVPGGAVKKRKRNQAQVLHGASNTPAPKEIETGDIELFGRIDEWGIIMKGAREVGHSHLKGKTNTEKPGLATNTVKALVDTLKSATGLYNHLGSWLENGMSDEDILHTEERLASTKQDIFEAVGELSEDGAGNKKSEVIQDIYAHAIPNMVFWLRAAMLCRTGRYRQEEDIASLQEIVGLQELILQLCEKARQWKAKPLTDRPIINSTARDIKPYLRDVKRAFDQVLERRERVVRHQSNELALAQSHERRRELQDRQKKLNTVKKMAQRMKIVENLRSRPSPYRKQVNPSQAFPGVPEFSYHQQRQPFANDEWTTEQNLELVRQLMRPDIKDLPGKSS